MTHIKYPIGIQHFPTLIEDGYLYIDKTELIHRLLTEGRYYFFSRPRRFGKSLLISTLEALFHGRRELFDDLAISSTDYDWQTYPVISLDFSELDTTSPDVLMQTLQNQLKRIADRLETKIKQGATPADTLIDLLESLARKKQVVVLIDEYDKPMVDNLADMSLLEANRNALRRFFMILKSLGRYLRFVFVTGVSKFSKVSLFSGMNNLADISLSPTYASLVGLTEEELNRYFTQTFETVAKNRGEEVALCRRLVQRWYNGYRFSRSSSAPSVYNPLSILRFLQEGELNDYWFDTATPTFAIELVKQNNYPVVDFESGASAGYSIDTNHEVDQIDLVTLLYQTGYLTIANYSERTQRYLLKYPNEEVKHSFLGHLMSGFSGLNETQTAPTMRDMRESLLKQDLDQFFMSMNGLLAQIPYAIQLPQERYYHSLIYLILRTLGFEVEAEIMTGRGRIDLVIQLADHSYLFEFKIDSTVDIALAQIEEREYYKKYHGKQVTLIGVNVSTETRQIADWKAIPKPS